MTIVEPIRNIKDIKRIETKLRKKGIRDLLLFDIGINCGLRISDILALDVKDVKNKTYIEIKEKKTGKDKRLPINSKLKPMIEKYTHDMADDMPLFMTIFGNRLGRIMAYKIINKVCKEAGLNIRVGTHTMRKTFGYHHYKKFKDVAMLQTIFNHSTPKITLRYIGISQDEIDESYKNFIL